MKIETPIQYANDGEDDYELGQKMINDALYRYYERSNPSAKPNLSLNDQMQHRLDYRDRYHMEAFKNKVDEVLKTYKPKTAVQHVLHQALCVIQENLQTVLGPTTGRVRGLERIAESLDVLVRKHEYDDSKKADQQLWKWVEEIVELLENGPEHVDAGQDVPTVSTARASSRWTRFRDKWNSYKSRFSGTESRPSSASYSNLFDSREEELER